MSLSTRVSKCAAQRDRCLRKRAVPLTLLVMAGIAVAPLVAFYLQQEQRAGWHTIETLIENRSSSSIRSHDLLVVQQNATLRSAATKQLRRQLEPNAFVLLFLCTRLEIDESGFGLLADALSRCDLRSVLDAAEGLNLSPKAAAALLTLAVDQRHANRTRLAAALILEIVNQSDSTSSQNALVELLTEMELECSAEVIDLVQRVASESLLNGIVSKTREAIRPKPGLKALRMILSSNYGATNQQTGLAVDVPVEELDALVVQINNAGFGVTTCQTQIDAHGDWVVNLTWEEDSNAVELSSPLTGLQLEQYIRSLPSGQSVRSICAWPVSSEAGRDRSEDEHWRVLLAPARASVTHQLIMSAGQLSAFERAFWSRWTIAAAAVHPESGRKFSVIAERDPWALADDRWVEGYNSLRDPVHQLGLKQIGSFSALSLLVEGDSTLPINRRDAVLTLDAFQRDYLSKMLPTEIKMARDWQAALEFLDEKKSQFEEVGNIAYPNLLRFLALSALGRDEEAEEAASRIPERTMDAKLAVQAYKKMQSGDLADATAVWNDQLRTSTSYYGVACNASLLAEFLQEDADAREVMLGIARRALDFLDKMRCLDTAYALADPDLDDLFRSGWRPRHKPMRLLGNVRKWQGESLGFLEGPFPMEQLQDVFSQRTKLGMVPTCVSGWPGPKNPETQKSKPSCVVGWSWRLPSMDQALKLRQWARAYSWARKLGAEPNSLDAPWSAEALADATLAVRGSTAALSRYSDARIQTAIQEEKDVVRRTKLPQMVSCQCFGKTPLSPEGNFEAGLTEVTIGQYIEYCSSKKNVHRPELVDRDPQLPVTNVAWREAAEYCNWLSGTLDIPQDQLCYEFNEQGGCRLASDYWRRTGFRMPTIDEWYSIAGPAPAWDGFNGKGHLNRAWTLENASSSVQPVGQKLSGIQQLCDVWGNAAEWCESGGGLDSHHIVGGSASEVMSTNMRLGTVVNDGARLSNVGFRVVRWKASDN